MIRALAIVSLAACVDGVTQPAPDVGDPPVPTCQSLGCEEALCSHEGLCTCNGEHCVWDCMGDPRCIFDGRVR